MDDGHSKPTHVVILGGGFGGVYTTRHLERLWAGSEQVRISLISRDNYFLITPLLFEAGSGVLEPRHAVAPIRPLLSSARFIEAEVKEIDLERQQVLMHPAGGRELNRVPYDHLVLALGGVTNTAIIPGGDQALTFKTMGDAIFLRNHVIKLFEWADVETDPKRKAAQLTFIVVGAGFVGLELMGELTEFVVNVATHYKHVDASEVRFEMIEAGPTIAAEFDETLAVYSAKVLKSRRVNIRTNTKVKSVTGAGIELPNGETIESQTVIVATGVSPSPLVKTIALEHDQRGRIRTEATMRAKGRQNVWALGDCAEIPDPNGKPYPPLAQHALREAKRLAQNITAVIRGQEPQPFIYKSKGTLAALGHFKGAGRIYRFNIHGFFAWWVWRSYYVFQVPQWRRRLRIIIDWTIALFFSYDVVQLDLSRGDPHAPPPGVQSNSESSASAPSSH